MVSPSSSNVSRKMNLLWTVFSSKLLLLSKLYRAFQTNLSKGLGPDTGAHFEDGSGPLLQQTHIALQYPALSVRTGLEEKKGMKQR